MTRSQSLRAALVSLGLTALLAVAAAGCDDTYAAQLRACGTACSGRVKLFQVVHVDYVGPAPECICAGPFVDGGSR